MATIAVTRRHDLTDVQWAVLAPLLPAGNGPGRPSQWNKRQLIDGIRWRVRVGAPWRDVPACYGSWQAVYALFRRWQRAGVWQQIVTGLQARADAAGLITWDVSVDSTIARAHQHAAGALRCPQQQAEAPGAVVTELADHALGRSRVDQKLHLACEQGGKPLSMLLTAGHRGDSPQFAAVLAGIRVPARPYRHLAEADPPIPPPLHLQEPGSLRHLRPEDAGPALPRRRLLPLPLSAGVPWPTRSTTPAT
ncbi:IS5 family transposase [Micromonospora sp. NPDC023633]|uniref:IS5 family transposase n=1 Tax=Micromonospora sp. NPDC023633 TaxID=3154320 RepID=UPI0033EFB4CC